MSADNNGMVIGRLCRDWELRYSAGEGHTAYATNTIALKQDGQFFSVIAFGERGEKLAETTNKGNMIAIQYYLQASRYVPKGSITGKPVTNIKLVVLDFKYIEKRKKIVGPTDPSGHFDRGDGSDPVPGTFERDEAAFGAALATDDDTAF